MHLFTSKCDTTNYGGKIVKNAGTKCGVESKWFLLMFLIFCWIETSVHKLFFTTQFHSTDSFFLYSPFFLKLSFPITALFCISLDFKIFNQSGGGENFLSVKPFTLPEVGHQLTGLGLTKNMKQPQAVCEINHNFLLYFSAFL